MCMQLGEVVLILDVFATPSWIVNNAFISSFNAFASLIHQYLLLEISFRCKPRAHQTEKPIPYPALLTFPSLPSLPSFFAVSAAIRVLSVPVASSATSVASAVVVAMARARPGLAGVRRGAMRALCGEVGGGR